MPLKPDPAVPGGRHPRLLVLLLLIALGSFYVFWKSPEWWSDPLTQHRTVAECVAGECEGLHVLIDGALVPGSLRLDTPGCAGSLRIQPPGGGESFRVCSTRSLADTNFHCGDEEMRNYMELGYLELYSEGVFRNGVQEATRLSVRDPCNPKSYRFKYGTPEEILKKKAAKR